MPATKSEDVLGVKYDQCLADTATKMAGGFVMGKEEGLGLIANSGYVRQILGLTSRGARRFLYTN
jgi:hypothetical protein